MADKAWQRLPKARRASVYRAIGRAARMAREDRDKEIEADLRIAMNVLRSHAKAPKQRKPTKKKR
jgi:hypothetical protein